MLNLGIIQSLYLEALMLESWQDATVCQPESYEGVLVKTTAGVDVGYFNGAEWIALEGDVLQWVEIPAGFAELTQSEIESKAYD